MTDRRVTQECVALARYVPVALALAAALGSCSGKAQIDQPVSAAAGGAAGGGVASIEAPRAGSAGVPIDAGPPQNAAAGAAGSDAGASTNAGGEPDTDADAMPPMSDAGSPPIVAPRAPDAPGCNQPPPPMQPLPTGGMTCQQGCREVIAYPADAQRGCIDTQAPELIACSCAAQGGIANNSEGCLKDQAGSYWLVSRADELGVFPFSPDMPAVTPLAKYDTLRFSSCSRDEDLAHLVNLVSCELMGCKSPEYSHCPLAQTSAGVWRSQCDGSNAGPYVGYDSLGCRKPSCTIDTDCNPDERCVDTGNWTPDCSLSSDGTCSCGGGSPTPNLAPTLLCVSVALSGPRGAWQSYRIDDADSGEFWLVSADGSIESNSGGALHQSALAADALPYLNADLDGLRMRLGVSGGFQCEGAPVVGGAHGTITLTIAGKPYARDISGCLYEFPEGNLLLGH